MCFWKFANQTVNNRIFPNTEVLKAYTDYERQINIRHLKIGCYLVAALMPIGMGLDYFVYPQKIFYFFILRLACAFLAGVVWIILRTTIAEKIHKILCLTIALLPAFFICWMIYATDGADSPYYAGLNLILLAIPLVVRWSIDLSVSASMLVIAMYLTACSLHTPKTLEQHGIFANNIYFLSLTAIIVIVSGWVHRALRINEFALNYELGKSRKALEASLAQIKENEAQLVHSEKLASLGRMSAGMIHEINNPLNFTTTALFTLRKKGKHLPPEEQKDYAEILNDVEEGVGRVKTIVSDLRVFTRPDNDSCTEVAVAEVVAAALRFLNIEHKEEVHFEEELPPNLSVWANKNKLIHVLANLLQNSLDALKTKTFINEKPVIRIAGRMENGLSFLSVRDNGPGIAAAHLNKIYDPFFTTKDVGAGMGLGLSICYRLVHEAQGKISVKTEPGKFCEFILEFPSREKNLSSS